MVWRRTVDMGMEGGFNISGCGSSLGVEKMMKTGRSVGFQRSRK